LDFWRGGVASGSQIELLEAALRGHRRTHGPFLTALLPEGGDETRGPAQGFLKHPSQRLGLGKDIKRLAWRGDTVAVLVIPRLVGGHDCDS
jgi:hypothetical protein